AELWRLQHLRLGVAQDQLQQSVGQDGGPVGAGEVREVRQRNGVAAGVSSSAVVAAVEAVAGGRVRSRGGVVIVAGVGVLHHLDAGAGREGHRDIQSGGSNRSGNLTAHDAAGFHDQDVNYDFGAGFIQIGDDLFRKRDTVSFPASNDCVLRIVYEQALDIGDRA